LLNDSTSQPESSNVSPVIKSLGVDWITCTTREPFAGISLISAAEELAHSQALAGHDAKLWGMAGFEGFVCGGVQWGNRNQEAMVRLSSDAAFTSWRSFYRLAESVTRIDLQATVFYGPYYARRITRDYRHARRFRVGKARSASVSVIRCTDGGYTVYLGKRASDRYGRIYDKWVESRLEFYRECVRYEVEFKGRLALGAARAIAKARNEVDATGGLLRDFFCARGIDLPAIDAARCHLNGPQVTVNDHRSLEWLRAQVRPTIERLIKHGHRQAVYDALNVIGPAVGAHVELDHGVINSEEVM